MEALVERIHRDGDVARAMLEDERFAAHKVDAYLVEDAVPLKVPVAPAAP